MKKILFVLGTRPEAIKLNPVIKQFGLNKSFETLIFTTGQQESLLNNILDELNIIPNKKIKMKIKNSNISQHVSDLVNAVNKYIIATKPNLIIVQGDTSTAFAAALSAFLNNIPIAHVEAGLRSLNLDSPFPEEGYRQMISRLSRFNFAPTSLAKSNLLSEGVAPEKIFIVGNTIVDSVIENLSEIESVKIENKILITLHRRENFGKPLTDICNGVYKFATENQPTRIKIIMHPNPNSSETIVNILGKLNNIELISPLRYVDLLKEILSSIYILTDSGGIQEECNILKVPLLIARNETERPEVLSSSKLLGTSSETIYTAMKDLFLNSEKNERSISFNLNSFGDGNSALQIAKIIESSL
jgi:UDP-N-acetylglucosamine 2-epimerase (non-hydrolysing)